MSKMMKGPGSFQMLIIVLVGIVAFFMMHREISSLKSRVEELTQQFLKCKNYTCPMKPISVDTISSHSEMVMEEPEVVEQEIIMLTKEESVEEPIVEDVTEEDMQFTENDVQEILEKIENE